ncbi:MAG: hypothetical protein K0Q87_5434 [Neobacillus sp.]|jgi:predicted transporter|nr:hypothetical protein [Neobacillus sp.]
MKIRQIINFEKNNMNKIRFIMNYRIVPVYLTAVTICIIIISVIMSIDEIKYTPISIVLFSLIGIFSVLLLSFVIMEISTRSENIVKN